MRELSAKKHKYRVNLPYFGNYYIFLSTIKNPCKEHATNPKPLRRKSFCDRAITNTNASRCLGVETYHNDSYATILISKDLPVKISDKSQYK